MPFLWNGRFFDGAAGGGGAATDPHWSSVVLLVGFDGPDGATTFTDESSAARTLTPSGDAQIDTAHFKFGTGSGLFDATGDLVTTADSTDWEFPGEFTIECWIRPRIVSSGTRGVVAHWAAGGGQANWSLRQTVAGVEFVMSADGSSVSHQVNATSVLAANTWFHAAVDRDAANKLRIYAGGIMRGSKTSASGSFNSPASLRIGSASGTSQLFDGHIDELRITKGVARYASDAGFAVPTAAYPRS